MSGPISDSTMSSTESSNSHSNSRVSSKCGTSKCSGDCPVLRTKSTTRSSKCPFSASNFACGKTGWSYSRYPSSRKNCTCCGESRDAMRGFYTVRSPQVERFAEHDLQTLSAKLEQWGCKRSHAGRILRAFYDRDGELNLEDLEIGTNLRHRLTQS